jgi:hypothetical protein
LGEHRAHHREGQAPAGRPVGARQQLADRQQVRDAQSAPAVLLEDHHSPELRCTERFDEFVGHPSLAFGRLGVALDDWQKLARFVQVRGRRFAGNGGHGHILRLAARL